MTKISQLSSIGDSLAVDDQFLIRDVSDGSAPNKSVTVSGITRALDVGTAAAPAIAFATDKNTGIYSPGADQVAISTNGTGRLFVDANGGVGIGNNAPSGTGLINGLVIGNGTDNKGITLYGTSATQQNIAFTDTAQTQQGLIQYDHSGDYMRFFTASSERLRITSAGLVGIGTSSPQSIFHIGANAPANAGVKAYTALANSYEGFLFDYYYNTSASNRRVFDVVALGAGAGGAIGGSDIRFLTVPASATGTPLEAMRIDSAQRVGIGSTGPLAPLHIEKALPANDAQSAAVILSRTSNIGSAIYHTYSSAFVGEAAGISVHGGTSLTDTSYTKYLVSQNGTHVWYGPTTSDERARIDSSGRLLVGTSTTASAGGVSAQHAFSHSTSSQWAAAVQHTTAAGNSPFGLAIKYTAATPNNTTSDFLFCEDATALRARIYSNGGLGNYSGNNVNLSDINTKKDISPAAGTWDCIKEWEIVNYRYKDQPDDSDLNLGVIAQQVAESCPEVITVFEEAKDDQPEKLGIKEQQMYWMAIKALQEAQVRIEQLEAKVAALESA